MNIVRILILTLLFVTFSLSAVSQVFFVKLDYCKKKEMEIITGDSIPAGYAVLQSGYFEKDEITGTIQDLTKKQVKTMKKYCKWRHCCKIFIAFKPLQDPDSIPLEARGESFGEWKKQQETEVNFYVLASIRGIILK